MLLALPLATAQAQDIGLQESGKMISSAMELYKAEKRDAAIRILETIHPGDTSYAEAQLLAAEMNFEKKDYKKTKMHALQSLYMPSTRRNAAYNLLALSYHHLGLNDSSDYYSELGLKAFPFDPLLAYNRGIVLNARGQWSMALDYFFKAIRLKPNFSSAHFMTGYLAVRADRPVQALMAWGFYVLTVNEKLDVVQDLEKISALTLELDEEDKIDHLGVPNAYSSLDKRFYNGEALKKNFDAGVKMDYAYVKQYRFIIDQMASIKDENDPFYRHYAAFYKQLADAKMFEPFVREMISEADDKKNSKWLKKNSDAVKAMYKLGGSQANKLMDRQQFEIDGKTYDLECWYQDFKIQALGEADSTKYDYKTGTWFFVGPNGNIQSTGKYENYKSEGEWKYFNDEGWLETVVQYKNDELDGDYKVYEPGGQLVAYTYYRAGELVDTGRYFYPCGALKRVTPFLNQMKHGVEWGYHLNGQVYYKLTFEAGKMVDTAWEWHDNGQLAEVAFYDTSDAYNGPFVAYFPNGKLYQQGNYLAGKRVGNWKEYADNGQLIYDVNYNDKGERHGKWLQYLRNGKQEYAFEYVNDEFNGTQEYFENGQVYCRIKSEAGNKFVEETYFDEKGNVRATFGDPSGNFSFITYRLNGKKSNEGQYVNGLASGEWKYYDGFGNLIRRSQFKDGQRQGKDVLYNALGQVEQEQYWVEGELDGLAKAYYVDGTLREMGNYANGAVAGRWENYHENGRMQEAYFIADGQRVGPTFHYAARGGIRRRELYAQSAVRQETYFDISGQPYFSNQYPGGNGTEVWPFLGGRKRLEATLRCDRKIDSVFMYHPNGALASKRFFVDGALQGKEFTYYASGKPESEISYTNNQPDGMLKGWYENGKLQRSGMYKRGEPVGDWKQYFENGQLEILERFDNEGLLQGWTEFYDALGQLAFEKYFEKGELKSMRYLLSNGKYCDPINMEVDTISVTTYFRNGKISSKQFYKAGMRQGEYVLYHSDGSLQARSHFILNVLHGPFEEGDPGGILRRSGRNVNGDYDGLVKYFNEKGLLVREMTYYAGWKEGIETTFDATGKVLKKEQWWSHESFPVNN